MRRISSRRSRDRAAFVFRRIPLPDCLTNDAWWLVIPRTCDLTAGAQSRTAATQQKASNKP